MINPKKADIFTLRAFDNSLERERGSSTDRAISYLYVPTEKFIRERISSTALDISEQDDLTPEIKYYSAWALLESAYSGLFSIDDSPEDTGDADSNELAKYSFTLFNKLDSRTKYISSDTPLELMLNQEIPINDILFGMKSRIINSFEDFMTKCPTNTTALSILHQRHTQYKRIAEMLNLTGLQIRQQIQAIEKILNYGHAIHSQKSVENFYANIRGVEAECAFLGAIWEYISSNYSEKQLDALALPASVRTDYGLHSKEKKADVIFYDPSGKYGVEISRSKVSNSKNGKNNLSRDNIIYLYGDRDLRLPSYYKNNGKYSYSPDFKGYKSEAPMVMHQMKSTIARINLND